MAKEDKKTGVYLGFKAGLITALCCITPAVLVPIFVFSGIGSVAFALQVPKYKYYFVVMSLIFIALSVWSYIKKKEKKCDIDTVKKNRNMILVAITTYIMLALLILYVLLPITVDFIYNNFLLREQQPTTVETTIPTTVPTTTLAVTTIMGETTSILTTTVPTTSTTVITTTISEYAGYRQAKLRVYTYCPKCPAVVTFALRNNPGVVKVSGDPKKKIWTIIYNPDVTSAEYLRYHIAGYDTDLLEDKEL